jgi:hypothetical protein
MISPPFQIISVVNIACCTIKKRIFPPVPDTESKRISPPNPLLKIEAIKQRR